MVSFEISLQCEQCSQNEQCSQHQTELNYGSTNKYQLNECCKNEGAHFQRRCSKSNNTKSSKTYNTKPTIANQTQSTRPRYRQCFQNEENVTSATMKSSTFETFENQLRLIAIAKQVQSIECHQCFQTSKILPGKSATIKKKHAAN